MDDHTPHNIMPTDSKNIISEIQLRRVDKGRLVNVHLNNTRSVISQNTIMSNMITIFSFSHCFIKPAASEYAG